MLFKTTADLKLHVAAINKNTAWASLSPSVDMAERKYIIPLISQAQYDALDAAYNAAPQTLTAAQTALLAYVQRSLAHYAFYEALPSLAAMVSDMGVTEQTSSEGTASPSRQWVMKMLQEKAIADGDLYADAMLSFLEANHSGYPLWKASNSFTITKELFIANVAQFEQHVPVGGSKRVWLSMRPFVQLCEMEYILPAISQSLFDDLKAKMSASLTTPLTPAYTSLLSKIQRPLAWLALYKALPFQAVNFTPGVGITMTNTADGHTTRQAADRLRFETAVTAAESTAQSFLRELKKHLDDHAAEYPLYTFGDLENDAQPRYQLPDNRSKRSFMV